MNPETGKIERVMGTTADNLDVFESDGLRLKFTVLCWQREWHSDNVFSMWFEFQKNEYGKRRPHIAVMIGAMVFQSGWLFG